ncbi:MAG: META domain-containing protein [Acidimicrobiales bacterium]
MRRLMALVLFAVLLAAACGDDSGGDDASGDDSSDGGTAATAEDVDGQTFASTGSTGHELVADTVVSLTFTDGTVSFSAGCNSMNAGYELTDGTLGLTSEVAGTMMACPPDLQEQDDWLSGFMAAGPGATIDGDVLTLAAGDETLELAAAS